MQFLSPSVSVTELCTPDTFAHRYRTVVHSLVETTTSASPEILIVLPVSGAKPTKNGVKIQNVNVY